MKKVFSLMLVLTLVLSLGGVSAFADGNMEYITFENGNMFSVNLEKNDTFSYEVKGLVKNAVTQKYEKVAITDPQNITWITPDSDVVSLSATSGERILITAKKIGQAKVTATYNGMAVSSNVTVFDPSSSASVSNITVGIDGEKTNKNVVVTIPTLDEFSLKDIYGQRYDDSGVAKGKVTALHGFLYALELKHDPDTPTTWDWDWVKRNVKVDYSGSYVSKVGADVAYGMTGWLYKVNNVMDENTGAAQYSLNNGDRLDWKFAEWGTWK